MATKIIIHAEVLNIYTGTEKHRHLHSDFHLTLPKSNTDAGNTASLDTEAQTTGEPVAAEQQETQAAETTATAVTNGPVDKNGNPLRGAALQAYLRNHPQEAQVETQPQVVSAGTSASASSEVEAETTTEDDKFAAVMADLNDERYKLRTFEDLCDKHGLTGYEMITLLDEYDVDCVFKTRRSDGVKLIGLASRN